MRLRTPLSPHWLPALALLLAAGLPAAVQAATSAAPRAYAVDSGWRPLEYLETGSSLETGAAGLVPGTTYEFRVGVGEGSTSSRKNAVSFARVVADDRGEVDPFVLWFQSGVVGCSPRTPGVLKNPWTFRTFEDAERELAGRDLTLSIHPVEHDPTGQRPPMSLKVSSPVSVLRLPMRPRSSGLVYPSDPQGCLVNAQETATGDLYVSGHGFAPGRRLEVGVVPNQRAWYVGDPIVDVTGNAAAAELEEVVTDDDGRFTVRAWDGDRQFHGAFDLVVHDPVADPKLPRLVGPADVVSFGSDTALVMYLYYPIGGPLMDIAGRPVGSSPYFQFADSFADQADPVWGAVDPTYVPVGHPGGTFAAYYVVDHRDVAGWAGATNLVDVSGGIEIHQVKAGCINGTDVAIWNAPLVVGEYDVVVDFGPSPAATAGTYVTDGNYDDTIDFLDGATQIGFIAADDPYDLGPFAIGQDSYSHDDFFPTLGSRSDVDLRAVVRYPATAPGVGTPSAPGLHPIFLIEHGNHSSCNTPGFDCTGAYDLVHTGCPDRELNHEGYMGLLDRLASHGIIAVSIDAYDLTGCVPQLIPERSQLILKHLELWSHMNNLATFPSYPDFFAGRFAAHLDMNKISVSGHSRGGEASVGAYMLNTTFNIGSVSSIAPVDGQSYVLPDVPYFVILPAADGDVFSLSGQKIYDRAGSAIADATTKSGIDVYGASHNFFNTVWAADGDDGAPGRPDFIPAADQQRLGEAWLAAWARVHLNGETVYEDLFRGKLTFPSFAGRKIYAIRHEKVHQRLESGNGASAVAGGGTVLTPVGPFFSVHQTQALRTGWATSAATVTYGMAPQDVTAYEVLSFRAAQSFAVSNPATGSQNFLVELVGGGNTKGTFIGNFGPIPKPYRSPQSVMNTIRIPLHSFIINNSGVDLTAIDTVRIKLLSPTQGEIYVDDLEFSR